MRISYKIFLQIVEDLLELMSWCMFLAPLTHFRDQVDTGPKDESPTPEPTEPATVTSSEVSFPVDPVNQHKCRVIDSPSINIQVEGTGSDGYIMGLTALVSNHSWKVSVHDAVYVITMTCW